MFYESYTLGLHILVKGSQRESSTDPREPYRSHPEPTTANLGDLNPFLVDSRLLCIETLVELLH